MATADWQPGHVITVPAGEAAATDLRGKKVLLAFFPLAFTSTCTAELCDISEDYSQFGDTVVLPISVDSVATLREFKTKEHLAVDLLSDFKREATNAYGTMWHATEAMAREIAFVVVSVLVCTVAANVPRSRSAVWKREPAL